MSLSLALAASLSMLATPDTACSAGTARAAEQRDVVAVAAAAGSFQTLLAAAKAADLAGALANTADITVFAPTDEAFAKLPKGTVQSLLRPENKEKLGAILKLHVVEGRVYSEAVLAGGKATPLAGAPLAIRAADGIATVNGAKLLTTDIDAKNGVIHVIDAVLLPQR